MPSIGASAPLFNDVQRLRRSHPCRGAGVGTDSIVDILISSSNRSPARHVPLCFASRISRLRAV
jgi:hypothetical protein